jgi:hypothetical protein
MTPCCGAFFFNFFELFFVFSPFLCGDSKIGNNSSNEEFGSIGNSGFVWKNLLLF